MSKEEIAVTFNKEDLRRLEKIVLFIYGLQRFAHHLNGATINSEDLKAVLSPAADQGWNFLGEIGNRFEAARPPEGVR